MLGLKFWDRQGHSLGFGNSLAWQNRCPGFVMLLLGRTFGLPNLSAADSAKQVRERANKPSLPAKPRLLATLSQGRHRELRVVALPLPVSCS